ncbi:hypothetical protein [Hydrocarboniphaga sp.]|uniref:hypothetical protein n=1 Tax=Hydrocarboniphaga sp. TaxID=2033016 RepID=UPI003D12C20E
MSLFRLHRLTLAALLISQLTACGGGSDDGQADAPAAPVLAEYTIDDPLINESSGLARSQRRDDLLWTLNDSGGNTELYAITTQGRHVATLKIRGALLNLDWEDLASYQQDGVGYLLIGDMGDNSAIRPLTTYYKVAEPEVTTGDGVQMLSATPAAVYQQFYPDGPRDAEALAVDATDNMAYVLSKRDATPSLYRFALDAPLLLALPGVMEALGPINIPRAPVDYAGNVDLFNWVTAMDFDDAGDRAYVGTPLNGYFYVRQAGESWMAALSRAPRSVDLPDYPQIEAGTFAPGSDSTIYISSEQLPARLARLAPAN